MWVENIPSNNHFFFQNMDHEHENPDLETKNKTELDFITNQPRIINEKKNYIQQKRY